MARNARDGNAIKGSRWRAFPLSFPSPLFVLTVVIALSLGGAVGVFPIEICAAVIGAIVMAIILILRQDELAAVIVIAVHLYVDWYLALRIVAPLMVLVMLLFFFLARSPRYPWTEPPALWLWALLLVLAIYPTVRGALRLYDAFLYYPNIILGALIIFWLGMVIARNPASVRRFFIILSGFGTLLALHAIIQDTTGVFLFASSHLAASYDDPSYYLLIRGSDIQRLGSFFIGPDWNGMAFAVMLFVPLGLFVDSSSVPGKLLYVVEAVLMLFALLLTYSGGAVIASVVGILVFTMFVGRTRYRIQIPLFVTIATLVFVVGFPSQINLLLQHATGTSEVSLRVAAWQTAWRVIQAFPLTGIGLGVLAYQLRAEPYRVPAQIEPLGHPHNSYLELGAMAGLPVLFVFVALVFLALGLALRNWSSGGRMRPLIGAGIAAVVTLSIGSVSINAWTLPPLAAIGWLVLGVIASPLLAKSEQNWQGKNHTGIKSC